MQSVTIAVFSLCISFAFGFTKHDMFDIKCPANLQTDKNLDPKWMTTATKKWYFSMIGRRHLSYIAMDIGDQSLKEVDEDDMDECVTLSWKGMDATVEWNGKSKEFKNIKPNADGSFSFNMHINEGKDMRFVNTLTDNKDFVLYVICTNDGQGTFAVASTSKKLSKEDRKSIILHLIQLGFDYRQIEEPDCEESENDEL